MAAAIEVVNLSKRFVMRKREVHSFQQTLVNIFSGNRGKGEAFWALSDVSFKAVRGETLGVIGGNGSGKSTLLKIITRIIEPTKGSVRVEGRISALIELGAGFHPDLSGRENIFLQGSILGMRRKEIADRVQEIIDFSELERFIDMPLRHYSSGMQARLGFAMAVSVEPEVLIVDEVLAVGDEGFQHKCLDKIEQIRDNGAAILFVSHALPQVERLCQRVLWLDNGKVVQVGTAAEVIPAYKDHFA